MFSDSQIIDIMIFLFTSLGVCSFPAMALLANQLLHRPGGDVRRACIHDFLVTTSSEEKKSRRIKMASGYERELWWILEIIARVVLTLALTVF